MNILGGTGTEVYWHTYGTAADKKLAGIVAPKLASKTGMRNRGVKQAQFAVLGCKATAILCEGGFMDTANDYRLIISDSEQQAYADAVVEALVEYLGLTKKTQTTTSTSTTSGTTTTTSGGYLVKIVNCTTLNVRKGAGTSYEVVTTVKVGEAYTIVEESNGWGRLKSGVGWISLAYTQKI